MASRHQNGQCAGHPQVFGIDGFAAAADANHHLSQAITHIGQVGGQGQYGHNFTGHGDIETGGAFVAFFIRALSYGDAAQEAV